VVAALVSLFVFGILTFWIPAYWPVAVFQIGSFLLAVIALWREREPFSVLRFPALPLIFPVLLGLVQLATGRTAYADDTRVAVLKWATFLAICIVGMLLAADPERRRRLFLSLVWFSFLLSIEAILQSFTSDGKIFWIFPAPYSNHVMGPMLSANHWAVFIEIAVPLALYEAVTRNRNRLVYVAMVATMFASVLASTSRMGIALVSVEILVILALAWFRAQSGRRGVALVTVLLAAFFTLATAVVGWDPLVQRLSQHNAIALRKQFNTASLKMIRSRPTFGVGLGTWATVYPKYEVVDVGLFVNQAHNDWLEWTAEGGIPMGIAMFSLFAWCCYRCVAQPELAVGVLAVFVHALIDYPFSRPAIGSWTILMIALLSATATRDPAFPEPEIAHRIS
jgi:O-antigen ligase